MKRKIIAICLVLAAVALVAVGIILKQNASVYNKAIRICLECVGIG